MRTETTTKNIEVQNTQYFCEEEGCAFVTYDKREAEEHPWREHKVFKKMPIDLEIDLQTQTTLVFLETEEDFEQYQKLKEKDRSEADPWAGPGWYDSWYDSVPCPRGCCYETAIFLRPATVTVAALKSLRGQIDKIIDDLQELGIP